MDTIPAIDPAIEGRGYKLIEFLFRRLTEAHAAATDGRTRLDLTAKLEIVDAYQQAEMRVWKSASTLKQAYAYSQVGRVFAREFRAHPDYDIRWDRS